MDKLQAKKIIRDEEGHYVIIKEPVHQDNVTILMCMSQIKRALLYIYQVYKVKLSEPIWHIDELLIIVGNFNMPLLIIDRMIKSQQGYRSTKQCSSSLSDI